MEYGFAVGCDYRIGMNIDVTITYILFFYFLRVSHTKCTSTHQTVGKMDTEKNDGRVCTQLALFKNLVKMIDILMSVVSGKSMANNIV